MYGSLLGLPLELTVIPSSTHSAWSSASVFKRWLLLGFQIDDVTVHVAGLCTRLIARRRMLHLQHFARFGDLPPKLDHFFNRPLNRTDAGTDLVDLLPCQGDRGRNSG